MGDFATAAMLAVNTLSSAQQAKAQQAAATARQRADIQQRQYQLQIEERRKRDRLKRQEAARRARFGAQGVASAGGSAAALLQGLRNETEREIAEMHNLQNMRLGELNRENQSRAKINLLEHRNDLLKKGLGTAFNLLEKN